MKKFTIWLIATLMGISFATLLGMQLYYYYQVVHMRKDQFDESVKRSLFRTVRQIETNEVEQVIHDLTLGRIKNSDTSERSNDTSHVDSIRRSRFFGVNQSKSVSHNFSLRHPIPLSANMKRSLERHETSAILKAQINHRYLQYKTLVNDVTYHLIYENSGQKVEDRVDPKAIDRTLSYYLHSHGIKIPYHIRITTSTGREIYRCSDYSPVGEDNSYTQVLFPNEVADGRAILHVHFPDIQSYIFSSMRSIIPAMLLTIVLLFVYCITIWLIVRQRRMSEMKTDFINNMTHEFKTPLSTLSLAAQMLNDPSVGKSEAMIKHITGIINDETKRLRFQVEKVLQISMFEKQGGTFKRKEFDLHEVINDVVTTFRLKVESMGGEIQTHLEASDATLYADEMHITNVLFNLLDNAIKYHRQGVKPQLEIYTHNHNHRICIHVKDNGIGIKREDLRKIFDKFFRVHTGNRHDVKGFGLGLCYVKSVIENHKGNIHAESTLGEGTTFYIELPLKKKNK